MTEDNLKNQEVTVDSDKLRGMRRENIRGHIREVYEAAKIDVDPKLAHYVDAFVSISAVIAHKVLSAMLF